MNLTHSPEKDAHVPAALDTGSKAPSAEKKGGPILRAYTLIHVVISLVAIGAGLVVLAGMIASNPLPSWTAIFLWTTLATSVTGFFFPFTGLKPSYVVGAISCVLLTFSLLGWYSHGLAGAWRWIYVVTATMSLYLNVFVPIVQSFQKIPSLHALAPKQNEPPFVRAQMTTLILFVAAGTAAVIRFHP